MVSIQHGKPMVFDTTTKERLKTTLIAFRFSGTI